MDTIPAIKQIHEQTGFLVKTGKIDRLFSHTSAATNPDTLKFYYQASNGRSKRVGRILNGHAYRIENQREYLENSQLPMHFSTVVYRHEPVLESVIYPAKEGC